MSDRTHPHDALGNPLKSGQLVVMRVPEMMCVVRVIHVQPSGTIQNPEGEPFQLEGKVGFLIEIPTDRNGCIGPVMVLKTNEKQEPNLVQ